MNLEKLTKAELIKKLLWYEKTYIHISDEQFKEWEKQADIKEAKEKAINRATRLSQRTKEELILKLIIMEDEKKDKNIESAKEITNLKYELIQLKKKKKKKKKK